MWINEKLNMLNSNSIAISSGWWYTYPSEKYEFVNWAYYSQDMESHKSHVPNHQPVMIYMEDQIQMK